MSPLEDPEELQLEAVEGPQGLYIALISVHGRIRGHDLELGVEPDTGGQTLYVVELARMLAECDEVDRVELFTRRIVDPLLSPDYAERIEVLSPKARIIRIPAGPDEFVRKEELWDHLDSFADNMHDYLRKQDRLPDVVHGHYADAGYVGIRVANHCGCPLVFTGHSLGRVKRRRLLAGGLTQAEIEEQYNISRRIEAEEETLAASDLVITSTRQEIEEQYEFYDHYRPSSMHVAPPGLDFERFHASAENDDKEHLERELSRFLREPELPMVLAIARPDVRKNLVSLVRAFGEFKGLRKAANLVILAGNRDDVRQQDEGVRSVISNLLLAIDAYDIYGRVAVPKHHRPDDVPLYYRMAAHRGGVFVNPALTEPFGLTLLEAAGCGLPIVATEDGGPQEILEKCENGLLIDPTDPAAIAKALLSVISNEERWRTLSHNGIEGVRANYSWKAHTRTYLNALQRLPRSRPPTAHPVAPLRENLYTNRAVFTDIDRNLLGDSEAISRFSEVMRKKRSGVAFGIATCRSLKGAIQFLRQEQLPPPDVLITSVGTEIHYAPKLVTDSAWRDHINHLWNPWGVHRLLDELPGLTLQPKQEQSFYKISYSIDPTVAPDLTEIVRLLRHDEQTVNAFLSFGRNLDIIPVRASKGAAIRYVADQWGIPIERVLAAGGSGADEDMMRGNTLAVVVANRHQEELSQLDSDAARIYFAERPYADGILEAIDYYDFYGRCGVPEE
jgi:sucrose-phosphate synthase